MSWSHRQLRHQQNHHGTSDGELPLPNEDGQKTTEDAEKIRKFHTASGGGDRVSSDDDNTRYLEIYPHNFENGRSEIKINAYADSCHAYARTAGNRYQERRCWREVVLERGSDGGGGAIIWFSTKREIVAVEITEVEYIALSEVRNVI